MTSPDYYRRLGVSPDASREEIHSAYRRLARRYHPDLNQGRDAGARFNELSDAYAVLRDPARRARYDRSVAPTTAARVPSFTAGRSRRDAPRFLGDERLRFGVRLRRRPRLRVQLVVRFLR
jgi:DnaJ-class molecular chaperone